MEKFITEFKQTTNDGDYTVSVVVFQIEKGKLQETIDLLKGTGFKFTGIDSDSIYAEFVGGYDSGVGCDRANPKGRLCLESIISVKQKCCVLRYIRVIYSRRK